jgi:hypothetical protein
LRHRRPSVESSGGSSAASSQAQVHTVESKYQQQQQHQQQPHASVSAASARPKTTAADPVIYHSDSSASSAATEASTAAASEDVLHRSILSGDVFMTVMMQRLTSLRLLRQCWERGDMNSVLGHMRAAVSNHKAYSSISDNSQLVTINDFLSSADMKSRHINLDVCVQLVDLLSGLLLLDIASPVSSSAGLGAGLARFSPVFFTTAIRALTALCESFGELVQTTRAAAAMNGGVDLSREERLAKCDSIFESLVSVRSQVTAMKVSFRKEVELRDAIACLTKVLENIIY